MTQPNDPTEPVDPNQPNPPEQPQPAPPPPPKKKRRRWLKVTIGILVVLILLVIFLPTIASLGFARSLVISQVNKNLNGKLAVDNWSLGWLSGAKVQGFRIVDSAGNEILNVPKLNTQLTVLDVVRGKFKLGKTTVDGPITFALVVDKEGKSNVAKLPKNPAPSPPPKQETKLPDVSCDLSAQAKGTIKQEGQPTVYVDSANITAKIDNINEPISNDVDVQMRVGEAGKPGSIKLAGTIDAVKDNQVLTDLGKIVADEKVEISGLDLSAANAFIPAEQQTSVAGLMSGTLALKADGKSSATADGGIAVDGAKFQSPALKGDTFQTQKVNIPIQVTATVVDPSTTRIDIKSFRVEMPDIETLIAIQGQLTQQALDNLKAHQAPGSAGTLSATVSANNFKKLADQLPHLLSLQKGVTVEGGKFTQATNLTINPQNVVATTKLDLADVRGTNNGKPVSFDPVSLSANATLNPGADVMKSLADLGIQLTSAFAQLKGGGPSLAKIDLNGSFDLTKLREQLSKFSDLGQTKLDGNGTLSLGTSGELAPNSAVSAKANIGIPNLLVSMPGDKAPLNLTNLTLSSNANVQLDENSALKNIKTADVSIKEGEASSPLIDVVANASDVDPKSSSVKQFVSKIAINDLSKAQPQLIDPIIDALKKQGVQITRGGLYANVSGSYDGSTKTVKLDQPLQVSTPQLTVVKGNQSLLKDEKIGISVNGALSLGGASAGPLAVSVKSTLATAELKNLFLATGAKNVWDQLTGADAELTANLPKLSALSNAFKPPATQPTETPPMEITSGDAHIVAKISRDPARQLTALDVSDVTINKLALQNGQNKYAFPKPITLKLASNLKAAEQIESIEVTQLAGDLGVMQISMPQKLIINNPTDATKMTAAGQIEADGKIDDITALLAALNGGNEMPYGGMFKVTQKLSTDASSVVTLDGNISAKDFKVYETDLNGKKLANASFTEPELAIGNNLQLDQKNSSATINSLTVNMPQSKAASVKVVGKVNKYDTARELENIRADITYDLAKLWPIVHPMMIKPGQEDTYKDLKIAGAYTKTFNIKGSYPAKVNGKELLWYESVKTLEADGDLAVDSLDTNGINLQKLEVPIWLKDGLVILKYANKAKAESVAKPAIINNGTLNLGGIVLDVGQETMRLSIGKNQKLVQHMTINPLLGDTLGKYINPVFTNSKRAKGLLDVTVEQCDKVALGDVMKTPKSGKAKIVFSLTDMDIANPLGSLMLGPLLQAVGGSGSDVETFRGQIRNAVVTLDAGRTTQQITMELQKEVPGAAPQQKPAAFPMTFAGDINLATLQQSLAVTIPTELIASGGDWKKTFPNGIPLTLKGTTTKPQVDVVDVLTKIGTARLGGEVGKVLGGEKGGQSPLDKIGDILGGQKEDKEKQPDTSTTRPKKKNPGK